MNKYPWGKMYAADIESTGLLEDMRRQENPRLHNLGMIDVDSYASLCIEGHERERVQNFLNSGPTLIMHNGATFDNEALILLGFDVSKVKIIDTLFLAWYLEPERHNYGLAYYGEEFGVPKPAIEDWENQTQEEYNHRVMEDCKIQLKVWEKFYNMLLKIYRRPDEVMRFVEFLMTKARQQVIQQRTRWRLDIPKAEAFRDETEAAVDAKQEELALSMPEVIKYEIKTRPAKFHKQNGSLSVAGLKWKTVCELNGLDWQDKDLCIKMIKSKEKANPGSHVQVKDWLFSLGWEPETFKFKRNKETGETSNIPQISVKDEDGNADICPSLYKLAKKNPGVGIEHLIGLGQIKHRRDVVRGFLRDVSPDGFLTARCGGLTNTLRLKHRELVNLPSLRVYGGEQLRGMLLAEDDSYEQLGSDLCSLEDRCKHHYQWAYDPEYVKKQLAPDYDAHLAIGVIGGFITEKQSQDHKDGIAKVKERPMFKTTNYACQYGAGVKTVARSAECDYETGLRLHTAYWNLNWSIKEISANTTVKTVDGQMWQLNPVNNFWYSLRTEKDRFSTLCQGTGAYVFDVWCNFVIEICNQRYGQDPKLSGQFHDELILQVKKGFRPVWEGILHEAMTKTNELLKLNRDCACDIQFGDSYAEIH